jgi:small conductance mechanosensitive channel
MNSEEILGKVTEIAVDYGPKLLGAIVVLLIGGWAIRLIMRRLKKLMQKSNTPCIAIYQCLGNGWH